MCTMELPAAIPRAAPLREAVYERIAQQLVSGVYQPGNSLNEAKLSVELGVSRTPVREALLRLAAEGVLEATLARGFTVKPLTSGEAQDLYPILGALEALAVRSARGYTKTELREFKQLATVLRREADPLRRWQIDTQWHELLASNCGNGVLKTELRRIRTSVSRYEIAYMRDATDRSPGDDGHKEIIELLSAGLLEQAAERVEQHWSEGLEGVLRWVRTLEGAAE